MAATASQASDLLRHIRVAADAADEAKQADAGSAPVSRCCDVLKLLQTTPVTKDLLASTGAGKAVRKLMSHPDETIKATAGQVVHVWKTSVSNQLNASAAAAAAADAQGIAVGSGQAGEAAQPAAAAAPPVAAAGPAPDAAEPRLVSTDRDAAIATAAVIADAAEASATDGAALRRQESDVGRPAQPRAPFEQPEATGNPARDNVRKGLANALLTAVLDEFEDVDSPYVLAARIEEAAHEHFKSDASTEYKAKVRTLLFNLKDKKNPDLRRRVLLGEVAPHMLLEMTSEELASDAKRQENDKIRAHMKKETERTVNITGNITDMFKCGKCKKRRCTYYQMQTRSADEPMTTFVKCVECGHRWKFC